MSEKFARLAVLGSPIDHSRSPAIHTAAYTALGLPWNYGRHEVGEGEFDNFLTHLDKNWRGLSLTMPLKRAVTRLVTHVDPFAERTRQGNTILLDGGKPLRAYNTDVYGIVAAFQGAGVNRISQATVLGGGATAESAVVAMEELGARVKISARNLGKVSLEGGFASVRSVATLNQVDVLGESDAVVSTIAAGAIFNLDLPNSTKGRTLLDVAYSPWPSPLASAWADRGGLVIHGLEMLLHQAIRQVRIFVNRDPERELPAEDAVLQACRLAAYQEPAKNS